MIILHIANLDSRKSSGPNINVPKNILYGNRYEIVGLFNLKKSKIVYEIPDNRYFSIEKYQSIKELPAPFNKPDIVVFQGMYEINHCFIAKKLIKENIPYIVVPRCSLTQSAQKNKILKKSIANYLFFNRFIKNAKSIQFLTENEYIESKKCFSFSNYFILGNGMEIPSKKYAVKNRKEFKIVFIARYNIYHKGLDILLGAIKDNVNWFLDNNVFVNLYGSDSNGGLSYLKKYVADNNISEIVQINEPVFDNDKEKVLLDSDVFIHTSRLEGQPTAVIEAIAYGIPVIVTPGTNMSKEVKDNELGFVCDMTSNDIFNCIKQSFEFKNKLKEISENEIKYSINNFNWDYIVRTSIDEYKKIIDKNR